MTTEIKKLDLSKLHGRTNTLVEASHEEIDVFNNRDMFNDGTERGSQNIEVPRLKTKRTFFLKKLNPKFQTMKSPDEEEIVVLS